jgi:hypothetical protein
MTNEEFIARLQNMSDDELLQDLIDAGFEITDIEKPNNNKQLDKKDIYL